MITLHARGPDGTDLSGPARCPALPRKCAPLSEPW